MSRWRIRYVTGNTYKHTYEPTSVGVKLAVYIPADSTTEICVLLPEGDLLETLTLPPVDASSIRKLGNCWASELSAFFWDVPHVKDMANIWDNFLYFVYFVRYLKLVSSCCNRGNWINVFTLLIWTCGMFGWLSYISETADREIRIPVTHRWSHQPRPSGRWPELLCVCQLR